MLNKQPRERKKAAPIALSDLSARPDVAFVERIAFHHNPFEEDLAILAAWSTSAVQVVTR